jgi:hypothetical protein
LKLDTTRRAEPYDRLERDIAACLPGWTENVNAPWSTRTGGFMGTTFRKDRRERQWVEPSGANPVHVWLIQEVNLTSGQQEVEVIVYDR